MLASAPLCVLVVEDSVLHAVVIRDALTMCGQRVEVVTAETLEAAAAKVTGVDVVLLDLQLPDSAGPQALQAIGTTFGHLPVLVLTASEEAVIELRAMDGGAEDFLVKGQFDQRSLDRSIRHAMERFRLRSELRGHAEALEATIQAVRQARDGLVIADLDGRVLFANGLAVAEFGAVVGEPFAGKLAPGGRSDVPLSGGRVAEALVGPTTWRGVRALIATLRDVTEQRAAEQEQLRKNRELGTANRTLDALATHDALTGVWNRRGVETLVQQLFRDEAVVACLLLDCDDFKWVNDIHGHDTGDRALRELARVIAGILRPGDHLGRLGGDEFVILLPETPLASARAVADQICAAVSVTSVRSQGARVGLSCSNGVADATGARTLGEAVRDADEQLACSKARGKGCVSGADEGLGWAERPLVRLADCARVGREFYRGRDLSALAAPIHVSLGLAYFRVEAATLAGFAVCENLAELTQGNRAIIAVGRVALERLVRVRAALKDAGVPFGLGSPWEVGSVAYLRPDLISIGRRWTANTSSDPAAHAALLRMVAMAHATGARTFASDFYAADGPVLAAAGIELWTMAQG